MKSKNRSARMGIQMTIAFSFTLIACVTIVMLSMILYNLFSSRAVRAKTESAGQFLTQTKRSMEDYLRNDRRISDALYYAYIKNKELPEESLDEALNLVYEANKDNVVSIALYTDDGRLLSAVPVSSHSTPSDIVSQEWFYHAVDEVENLHFSMPHVQNLGADRQEGYHWVISLSRAVELNLNGAPRQGVLLVDIKYSSIRQMLEKINSDNTSEFIYLCDGEGNIIYHPKQELMNVGLYEVENQNLANLTDGSYTINVGGIESIVITKTISYAGWKLISVVYKNGYNLGLSRMQYLIAFFIGLMTLAILLINQLVSRSITKPLILLDRSISEIESGDDGRKIEIGGPTEVEHLGKTLQSYVETNHRLMDEVMEEQELKRRSELDALQSQINPHFLYNTLDSVMWMIEDEQNAGAVYMIKELAKLLRISISRGRTIISVEEEILHARSYMNIQKIRYKNQFTCSFEVEEAILSCATVKLILQPLLENAIYHGVQGMDEDGEILVRGTLHDDEIYLEVIDNGNGMSEEQARNLLTPHPQKVDSTSGKGNGVGLLNVDTRIKMRFGQNYGLEIESERGEGTIMRIRLPYMEYTSTVEEQLNKRILPASEKNQRV